MSKNVLRHRKLILAGLVVVALVAVLAAGDEPLAGKLIDTLINIAEEPDAAPAE